MRWRREGKEKGVRKEELVPTACTARHSRWVTLGSVNGVCAVGWKSMLRKRERRNAEERVSARGKGRRGTG
jgi:hypothetical protein